MAKTYSVNNTTISSPLTTGTAAIWALITAMTTAGWTMVRSSDGTTAGSGIHVTGSGTGAGGLGNTGAWVVMQQPTGGSGNYAGTRQICFQHTNAGNDVATTDNSMVWRIMYSKLAGFTGGSAAVSATATDQKAVLGGGTAGSPTFEILFNTGWGGYRYHIMAADATDADCAMGFELVSYPGGGGSCNGAIIFDPLTNLSSFDTDPFVFVTNIDGVDLKCGQSLDSRCGCWWNPATHSGGLSARYDLVYPMQLYTTSHVAAPAAVGTSPVSGLDDLIAIFWGSSTGSGTTAGYKGTSRMLRWRCNSRATGDTYSVSGASSKEYVIFGDLVTFWNGSSPLV